MAVTDVGWTSQEEIEAGLPVPGPAAGVSVHEIDTTAIHGILDTSDLVLAGDLSAHTGATTTVHGIADTSDLVVTDDLSGYVPVGTTEISGDLSSDSTTVPEVLKALLTALDVSGVIVDTTTTT